MKFILAYFLLNKNMLNEAKAIKFTQITFTRPVFKQIFEPTEKFAPSQHWN
jgi:hypothetical protein